MVVIRTYTLFEEITKTLGVEKQFAVQAEELRCGAAAITEAVLYVKQHSVNCVSSAMYAVSRFDPRLFPPDEAERFVSGLFDKNKNEEKSPAEKEANEIREYILSLYRCFLAEGESGGDWTKPLLDFMHRSSEQPLKHHKSSPK
jgi:hypothetical protein